MKRTYRLTSPRDFRSVFERGRRGVSDGIVCVVATGDEDHPARAGVVTGRALGTAVVRNRMRRRVRAIMAPILPEMTPGSDVVVVVRRGATGNTFQEMRHAVTEALDKAVAR